SAADRVLGPLPALKVRICPKNPRASIEIDVPASKPLRNTNFRLDGPTVGSNIDQLGRVVLAEGRHQNDAGASRSASPKLRELTCMHGGRAPKVYGEPGAWIAKPGAGNLLKHARHPTLQGSPGIRQQYAHVRRPAEKGKSADVTQHCR